MVVGTSPDNFVDVSIFRVDAAGAPGRAHQELSQIRAAPFIEKRGGIFLVLANDGRNADGEEDEGEGALHDDDELLRSGKLENVIEKKLRFNEL